MIRVRKFACLTSNAAQLGVQAPGLVILAQGGAGISSSKLLACVYRNNGLSLLTQMRAASGNPEFDPMNIGYTLTCKRDVMCLWVPAYAGTTRIDG